MSKPLLAAALAGVFAASIAASANAADDMTHPKKEKCYGIAKTGKNDCKSASGSHGCAGQAKTDNSKDEWKFAAQGECEKEGGSLTAPAAM